MTEEDLPLTPIPNGAVKSDMKVEEDDRSRFLSQYETASVDTKYTYMSLVVLIS